MPSVRHRRWAVAVAHAQGGPFVASVSKVRRPPRGRFCRVLYELEVIVAACGTPHQKASVVTIPANLPTRKCRDVRNWRANGPEDARIVMRDYTSTQARFYVCYNDWGKHRKLWSRRQFVVPIIVSNLREPCIEVSPHVEVHYPRVVPGSTKLTMEKNGAPFVVGPRLFAHRWLDDPWSGLQAA